MVFFILTNIFLVLIFAINKWTNGGVVSRLRKAYAYVK